MNPFRVATSTLILIAIVIASAPARSSQDTPHAVEGANLAHLHDFDFLVGEWRVHHKKLKERLLNSNDWVEFEGTCKMHQLMNGAANVDDNVLFVPGGEYRGVGLRAYDPKTAEWAIWWVDSRNPHGEVDPPVKGHFENGVGTFYADDTLRGIKVRVRFVWSYITKTTARWEQAYSPDGGKTWETNWTMEFKRVS